MLFLYISIGGLSLGGHLTFCHFAFIAASYLVFGRRGIADVDKGTWIQGALADHDPQTGLLNRRGMEKRLIELSGFLRRHNVVITLAALDIDHFKPINDQYGHENGAAVLREISRELNCVFRSSDYLAQWGGEEFLVALTHTSIADASSVLERLRPEIAGLREFSVPSVTLSMGAAEWRPGVDLAAALKQADVALYEAKASGRNKMVAAVDDTVQNRADRKPALSFLRIAGDA